MMTDMLALHPASYALRGRGYAAKDASVVLWDFTITHIGLLCGVAAGRSGTVHTIVNGDNTGKYNQESPVLAHRVS